MLIARAMLVKTPLYERKSGTLRIPKGGDKTHIKPRAKIPQTAHFRSYDICKLHTIRIGSTKIDVSMKAFTKPMIEMPIALESHEVGDRQRLLRGARPHCRKKLMNKTKQ